MSKKKFMSGLESVFLDTYDEEEVTTSVFEEAIISEKPAVKSVKRTGKNFSADMDDIILNSFVTENTSRENDNSEINYSHVKKPQRRPLSGIEALLSRTIDYADFDNDTKKRIVLILEQYKVEKLKAIAKEEQLFLKDIIAKSVSFYIDQYDKRKSLI